jgi:hypothetical protein
LLPFSAARCATARFFLSLAALSFAEEFLDAGLFAALPLAAASLAVVSFAAAPAESTGALAS